MADAPKHTNEELRKIAKDFLNGHPKGIFGVLDEKGLPTTSLMLYVIDDDLNVYFGTKTSFSKYTHIINNPVVALTVVEGTDDPLKVVDMRGDVTEVPMEDLPEIFTLFKEKNPAQYFVEGADDFTMFKLTPHFMRWLDGSSGALERADIDLKG